MAFPSTPVLDDFNRVSLGANWTSPFLGSTALLAPNGTQLPADASFREGRFNAISFVLPIEVYVTVATSRAADSGEVCLLYWVDGSKNGYAVEAHATGAWTIIRVDAGVQTTIQTLAVTACGSGDVPGIGITSDGTTATITAYRNGSVVGSKTDTTYPSLSTARTPGLETGDAAAILLDNFGGGSLATSTSVRPVSIPNPRVGPMALRRRFRRVPPMFASPQGATQQTLTISGVVAPAGTLAKQTQKPLGGGATLAGTIANQTQKPLSGALTAAGSLIRQATKILTGGTTPAGSVSKQTQKPVAGVITASGALVKLVSKFLSGTLSSVGSLVLTGVKLLSISGGITPGGTLVRQTSKLLTGNISPTGALRRVSSKITVGNITPAGSLIKQTAKILAGTLTSAGTAVIRGVKLLVLGGGITPGGTIAKQGQKTLAGAITPTGVVSKSVAQRLTGILAPAGSLAKQARKSIAGACSTAGSLLAQFVAAAVSVVIATTRTRSRGPGSSLTRRAGGSGLTHSEPGDGLTRTDPSSGRTLADGSDGDTRSDLGGS